MAEHYQLDVRQYQTVTAINGADGDFTVHTVDQFGRKHSYGARKLILATGYYDLPNYLDIPGEDLPKVMHYYHDPHPYFDQKVLVIGGKNSAAIAALDLWRHGAQVTLVHRGSEPCSAPSSTGLFPTSRTASRTGKSRRTSTAPSHESAKIQ